MLDTSHSSQIPVTLWVFAMVQFKNCRPVRQKEHVSQAGAVDPDQNVRLSYERHLVLERRSLLISTVINQTIITLADV